MLFSLRDISFIKFIIIIIIASNIEDEQIGLKAMFLDSMFYGTFFKSSTRY